jgi:hypothetical protein
VIPVVLIKAQTDKVSALAGHMADIDGVSEVFSVAGQYDLVAMVRKLPGIVGSETLIAFKVYSKRDIEAAFSLGLD